MNMKEIANMKSTEKAIKSVLILFIIALLFFGITTCISAVQQDHQRADKRVENAASEYGVEIEKFQRTRCLNGWLMVNLGAHAWVYPRDEAFNPIRCISDND